MLIGWLTISTFTLILPMILISNSLYFEYSQSVTYPIFIFDVNVSSFNNERFDNVHVAFNDCPLKGSPLMERNKQTIQIRPTINAHQLSIQLDAKTNQLKVTQNPSWRLYPQKCVTSLSSLSSILWEGVDIDKQKVDRMRIDTHSSQRGSYGPGYQYVVNCWLASRVI